MSNNMNEEVTKEVLKPRVGDTFPSLVQSVLSTVCPPTVFIAGLMQIYLGTPASRRAEAFIISIDERLTELEQKGIINKEVLLQDPQFNTIVMHSTQIVVRNHREEKLEILRNAVINSVLNPIEEDLDLIYLRLLDNLTLLELNAFMLLYSSDKYNSSEKNLYDLIAKIGLTPPWCPHMVNIFTSNGLLEKYSDLDIKAYPPDEYSFDPDIHSNMDIHYYKTDLGEKFYSFILPPKV